MNKVTKLFTSKLKVISVGLPHFAETLRQQGLEVEHVEIRKTGPGDQEIIDLLNEMGIDD